MGNFKSVSLMMLESRLCVFFFFNLFPLQNICSQEKEKEMRSECSRRQVHNEGEAILHGLRRGGFRWDATRWEGYGKKTTHTSTMVAKERLFCGSSTSTVCSGTDLRNGTSSKLNGLMWPLLQIIGSTTCKHRSMHRGTHTQKKR